LVVILAIVVGVLFATGLYMMLRRSLVKLIIGLSLISHGANLLIFTMSRLLHNDPVILVKETTEATSNLPVVTADFADPIVQAVILTAIVIGMGLQAFSLVLIKRVYQTTGTDDIEQLKTTDCEV
jgi:multicomponent Na+:H+ antiporter subunit C